MTAGTKTVMLLGCATLVALTLLASCSRHRVTDRAAQTPVPQTAPIQDPALRAWASGDGVIYATNDGGASWQSQPTQKLEPGPLAFCDQRRGWAGGPRYVMATTDGGATWSRQNLGVAYGGDVSLSGLACADTRRLWAVGDGIFFSEDGGASWSRQHSGVCLGISCRNARQAWVVQGGGPLLATTDAGASWSTVQGPPARRVVLESVACDDSRSIWAVGGTASARPKNCVLVSRDDGKTWKLRILAASQGGFDDVALSGRAHVWAVGADQVWSSADGGKHWKFQQVGREESPSSDIVLYAIAFSDELHGWAVGERYDEAIGESQGVIYGTTDGGATWERQVIAKEVETFDDITCVAD